MVVNKSSKKTMYSKLVKAQFGPLKSNSFWKIYWLFHTIFSVIFAAQDFIFHLVQSGEEI